MEQNGEQQNINRTRFLFSFLISSSFALCLDAHGYAAISLARRVERWQNSSNTQLCVPIKSTSEACTRFSPARETPKLKHSHACESSTRWISFNSACERVSLGDLFRIVDHFLSFLQPTRLESSKLGDDVCRVFVVVARHTASPHSIGTQNRLAIDFEAQIVYQSIEISLY